MFPIRNLYGAQKLVSTYEIIKRFAGHSKWQNIRHTKAAKDLERGQQTQLLLADIRRSILENGKVTDPNKNLSLQSAMNAAFKANVTRETVNNFLAKFDIKETTLEYQFIGPQGSALLVTFSCVPASVGFTRERIKKTIKKSCLQRAEGIAHMFVGRGVIIAKHPTKLSHDDAEEAAIISGAEEVSVQDAEENTYNFGMDSGDLWSVVKSLREDGWEILQSSIEQLPVKTVELSESELKDVDSVISALQEMPEFLKLAHNIA